VEKLKVEHQIAGLHALEIDDRDDAPHHHRELRQADRIEFLALERRVGGAEGHGLRLDLLDAAARTDRLVIEAYAGLLLVGVGPFRIDRIGEGGAGAGYVGGVGGDRRGRQDDGGRQRRRTKESVHGACSCWDIRWRSVRRECP
jgi:hypothetical protein